jgi:hypothetical protein
MMKMGNTAINIIPNFIMTQQLIIIFTRYPEPGKTKTRLIPALGEEGAANFQRQMTEYTLNQVKELQQILPIQIEIRFTDGNEDLMKKWLGSDLVYKYQGEGDLGEKLSRCVDDAIGLRPPTPLIARKVESLIIIGIDCPGVNPQILNQAFNSLQSHDLVIGPATDGGYYLIGLRHPMSQLFNQDLFNHDLFSWNLFSQKLFSGISWGTSEVLKQTIYIAEQLNLSYELLPTLSDIDRPEDLENFPALK